MTATVRPFVSIIVPCRNEERHMARCLQSVLDGDYPPNRLELRSRTC